MKAFKWRAEHLREGMLLSRDGVPGQVFILTFKSYNFSRHNGYKDVWELSPLNFHRVDLIGHSLSMVKQLKMSGFRPLEAQNENSN